MTTQRGGKRIGAGRKKGFKAIEAEKAREYVIRRVVEELESIISAQIALATGIKISTPDGNIYTKEPSLAAGRYLLDQTIGRSKESIEMLGKPQFSLLAMHKMMDSSSYEDYVESES